MVKHVILWKLKGEYSPEQKQKIKEDAKSALESLLGKIDGLLKIEVKTVGLPSSTVDLMLDSCFISEQALKNYSVNPAHVAVANTFVRPFVEARSCFDFEE